MVRRPRWKVDQRLYRVSGATPRQLRAAIELLGPRRGARRFAAFTDWSIHCNLGTEGFEVEGAATITLPSFRPPPSTPPEVIGYFHDLVAQLHAHELEHLAVARGAADKLTRALAGLPRSDAGAAAALCKRVEAEARGRERQMDERTEHGGRRLGAV